MISHLKSGFLAAPSISRRDEAGAKRQALIHTDVESHFNIVTTRTNFHVATPPRSTYPQKKTKPTTPPSYKTFHSHFSPNSRREIGLNRLSFNRLKKGGHP